MKNLSLLFTLFLVSVGFSPVQAQTTLQGTKVEESQVPQVVKDAYQANFSAPVVRWELHSKSKNDKSKEKYVAVFKEGAQNARARFKTDGTYISSSIYLKATDIPQNIQAAAVAAFSGMQVKSGVKTKVAKSGQEFYKVHMMKPGVRQRGTFICDLKGQAITKEKMPAELSEDEGEGDGR
ncbi:MAG: hypothetical protein HC913_08820 [Microscillaceae bacterium]|nr:hypothetical protein [Microscillaceae bacterium]